MNPGMMIVGMLDTLLGGGPRCGGLLRIEDSPEEGVTLVLALDELRRIERVFVFVCIVVIFFVGVYIVVAVGTGGVRVAAAVLIARDIDRRDGTRHVLRGARRGGVGAILGRDARVCFLGGGRAVKFWWRIDSRGGFWGL